MRVADYLADQQVSFEALLHAPAFSASKRARSLRVAGRDVAKAVLLAGHFKVLSTMNGERRAVSCVTHTTRPETEGSERSLGMFLNSLPVSIEVKAGTWRELIEHVAAVSMASMPW